MKIQDLLILNSELLRVSALAIRAARVQIAHGERITALDIVDTQSLELAENATREALATRPGAQPNATTCPDAQDGNERKVKIVDIEKIIDQLNGHEGADDGFFGRRFFVGKDGDEKWIVLSLDSQYHEVDEWGNAATLAEAVAETVAMLDELKGEEET